MSTRIVRIERHARVKRSARAAATWVCATCLALLGFACSADKKHGSGGSQDGGVAGTNGAAANGGSAGTNNGTAANGGSSAGASGVSATFGDGGSDLPACVTHSENAQQVPVDMYIMLDRSGSMLDMTGAGPTKWDAIRQALTTFVTDKRSDGLGVGLQYFPLGQKGVPTSCSSDSDCTPAGGSCLNNACLPPQFGSIAFSLCITDDDCPLISPGCAPYGICDKDDTVACFDIAADGCGTSGACVAATGECLHFASCAVDDYAAPAVPIATLPKAAKALTDSLSTEMPIGLTPTSAALAGALQAASAQAKKNPTHRVIAVLATDGTPTDCDPVDATGIALIANQARNATPSIQTYVIGVFGTSDTAALANLDDWAKAGGSSSAFIVDPATDVSMQFLDALEKIRGGNLACEFQLPPVPVGSELDLGRVNVALVEPSGTRDLLYVVDEAHCGDTELGWHYDADPNSGKATKIVVCSDTCAALKAADSAKIELRLGCKTMGPQ